MSSSGRRIIATGSGGGDGATGTVRTTFGTISIWRTTGGGSTIGGDDGRVLRAAGHIAATNIAAPNTPAAASLPIISAAFAVVNIFHFSGTAEIVIVPSALLPDVWRARRAPVWRHASSILATSGASSLLTTSNGAPLLISNPTPPLPLYGG
jgi:hypothetical protein